ncbi:MAG: MFS transporter [Chloroflexi bacterium]|nr:MFS transporter [Chloroflexota bacterium]
MKPTVSHTGASPSASDEFIPLPRRTVVLTMAGVMLAMFLGALDQTVVGTAMPRIIADLGGFDRYTWVTTAYLVSSTTVVPIVGRLSDIYGRKWFYVVGIAIFLLGSALSGLSQTIDQLILFRALQGLGGGVMIANAFVAIGDLFPATERGKYQGFIAAIFGLSSVVGPALGGFVTDTLSWHWVFYINIPLGVPVIALFVRYFPQSHRGGSRGSLDYLGMVTLVFCVVPLLLGLSWGGVVYAWASPQVTGALAVAALMGAIFVLVELRAASPIMPLTIFRNGVVSVSLAAIFLTGFGMFGAIIFVPLFFQGVLGSSATSSGSFLTPMMLGVVAGSVLSGQALSRLGGHYKLQSLAGLGIMAVGAFLLSRISAQTSYAQAVLSIVVLGLGLGTTFPPFTIAVQNAVPYRVMGIATSSTQFFRSIGGTLGLAVLGAFMTTRFDTHLAAALSPAIRQAMPPERLAELSSNPQALMSPGAIARLQGELAQLGPQGVALGQQLIAGLREALASAIGDVFLVAVAAVLAAWVITLFLKEIPLKGRSAAPPPSS